MIQSSNRVFGWGLFGVSFFLGIMLTIQLNSKNEPTNFNGSSVTVKVALSDELKHNAQLKQQITEAEEKIRNYQSIDHESILEKMKEDLYKANVDAGLTQVQGDGIQIEISEISDVELNYIVKMIKYQDAQAVSINTQRIVALSGIREVNLGVIQVNTIPITKPYVINAVGDIDSMKAALIAYGIRDIYLSMGRSFVIREVRDGSLIVPPYKGGINSQYATEDNQ